MCTREQSKQGQQTMLFLYGRGLTHVEGYWKGFDPSYIFIEFCFINTGIVLVKVYSIVK